MATIRIAVEQVEDRSGDPVKSSAKLVRRPNSSREFSIFAAFAGECDLILARDVFLY